MELSNYLIFASIAFFYITSPGPAVFITINYGVIFGFKKTLFLLLGNAIGLGILAFFSAIGIGSIIMSMPLLNSIVKIGGASVLIYISIKMMRSTPTLLQNGEGESVKTDGSIFKEGLILALSNPKPIIFFMSIYPQFIDFEKNQAMQFFVLGFTFMLISFFSLNVYSVLAKMTFRKLLTPKRAKMFSTISGLLLLGIGIFLILQTFLTY